MKKTLVLILSLMLPLAWAWSAEEDVKYVDNTAKSAIENEGTEFSPVKEGNLLDSTNPIPELPIITTNLLYEDFEDTSWHDPSTPPPGWTIIDNGNEGQQMWYNQDWHKYYYSASGFADTVARVYYSPSMEEQYDEWLITSDVVLPGTATACSLTFKTYYNDYSSAVDRDSAFILVSTDSGTSWDTLDTWGTDQGTSTAPLLANYDITSYDGQTVRVAFQVKTHGYVGYLGMYYWYLDNVAIWSDASALLMEDFNGWGPLGDNPPTGWSIIDNGVQIAADTSYNVNDYHDYTRWSSKTARVYYTSSFEEWQDEWMISPSFSISSAVECTLSVVEYYYHSTSGAPWDDYDHGYIKITTDGGSNWNIVYDNNTTKGSSTTPTVFQYDLSAYAGNTCQIAFHFVNSPAGYDYWGFDDVSVDEYVPPSEDAAVVSIDAPPVMAFTGGNYTITATIENLLADSTIIDSVLFEVDTSGVVVFSNMTYPGIYLQGYTSQQFGSSVQWNPTYEYWFVVTVTLYGSGDGFAGNNTRAEYKIMKDVRSYPYVEDMEYATVGDLPLINFILSGTSGGVYWSTSYSHSPTHCVYFSYSPYPREVAMVFPPVALTSATMPMMEYFEATYLTWWGDAPDQTHSICLMSGSFDLGNLDTLWSYDPSTHDPWDRGDFSNAPPIRFDMSSYVNDTVWIVMDYHEPTVDGSYWYLDDIGLREWPQDDIAATSIDAPVGLVMSGTVVSPKGTFTNLGIFSQTIDAVLTIEDTASAIVSVIYADTVTSVVIDSAGSYQVTFADWSIPGDDAETYTLTMEAINPGDENTADNVIGSAVTAYTHYSSGGPDDYGYRWIDNVSVGDEDPPVYSWIDITTVGQLVSWQTGSVDDGRSIYPLDLPGGFWYYGNVYDSVCIGTNAWMALVNQTSNYLSNYLPPSTSGPYTGIFAGWDDMDGGSVGSCYYYPDTTNNRFVVSWVNWPYYPDPTNPVNFQVILNLNDSTVVMQFGPATDGAYQTDITVGIQDSTRTSGLAYFYNGTTNPGNAPFDGLAIKFHYAPPAIDISVDNFTDTPTSGPVGLGVNPNVQFTNNGFDPANNVPVRLTITPGTYNDPQTITTLGPGATDTVNFSTFTPVSGGYYTMTAVNELADGDNTNDTLEHSYFAYDTVEDFEIDNGGLAGDGDWEWGTPTNVGPPSAHSGVNCWGTDLDDYRTNGSGTWVFSNLTFQLDLGMDNNAAIGFWHWYEASGSTFDSLTVKIDDGSGWVTLADWYGGPTADWENVVIDLSAYTGNVDINFQYGSTSSITNKAGWYIDDLALASCAIVTPDIDVTPLVINGTADPGFADYDTITISNTGDGTLNYTIGAYQDPAVTRFDGTIEPLYETGDFRVERQLAGYHPVEDKLKGEELAGNERGEPFFLPEPLTVGGPDAFGYTWIDSDEPGGPTYGWVDISAVGTLIPLTDDSNLGPFPLGFSVNYYGNIYNEIRVCSNGWASFTSTSTSLANTNMPATGVPNNTLSIFWDDLNPSMAGNVYYYPDTSNNRFIISYDGVPHYSNTGSLYFQIIINSDGTIIYQYDVMNHAGHVVSATIGIENSDGTVGLEYDYNSNPPAIHDSLAIQFDPPTFWLTTDVSSGSIPPTSPADLVEVTMDALELSAGIYTGRIEILSNDPDEGTVDIPVTFIVGGLGTIAGQVTDANTTGTLEGAIVTAGWVSSTTVVDTTDEGGNYSINITPGTVHVTVEMPGYQTDEQDVVVVEDQTTTHNVALGSPLATIDTSPVVDSLLVGDTSVYARTLYNTGTAPLTYSVALDFSGGGLGLNVQNNSKSERIMNIIDPTGSADISPFTFNNGHLPVITDYQDSIYVFFPESTTADNGCLGVEFDGTFFWVTGRNASGGDIHKLHKFDRNGNLIISYDQGTTTVWGWRDLAWDGQYLYGSDENELAIIDPAIGAKIGTLPMPTGLSPARALAYDPATDHFWSANFSSDIYEFDRTGAIIHQYANTKAAYGMAWDDLSEGGPWLWVNSQDGSPLMQISQFDPGTGTYTGESWQSALPDGHTAALAGGACFTTDWDPTIGALFVLGQGTPTDFVYGYEIATNITWLTVQSGGSGEIPAGDSATIEFLVDFRDSTIVPGSTYVADANINNNSIAPTPVIPFSITAYVPIGRCCYDDTLCADISETECIALSGTWDPDSNCTDNPCPLPGCDYVVGDVNGSGNYNGLDITYGVAFFKGGADPQCVECPLCPDFWYCGDVNASCNYNGLDITYGVAYFKGGPGPQPCDDCPPIEGPAIIGGKNLKSAVQPTIETKSKSNKGTSLK